MTPRAPAAEKGNVTFTKDAIAAAAERRLTPTERAHEALMASITRPPRTTGPQAVEVGQEARTKEWYVKSLTIYQADNEGWGPWARRVGEIAAAVTAELPVVLNGASEGTGAPETPAEPVTHARSRGKAQ